MDTTTRSPVAGRRSLTFALLTIGMCLMLVGTGAVGTVSATHDSAPSSHFVVELEEDGSATVSLVLAFELTDDERRDAFRTLEDDESARTDFRGRFVDRMRAVAAAASDETGREMTVSNPAIDLSRTDDGETGVATLSVDWSNLAAHEEGRLVVTQPFDGGFAPAHGFAITTPEGYRITEASPAPDAREETVATWDGGASLEGFRVVVEEASTGQDESRSPGQPGFGLVSGVLALLAATWAVGWRRL